MMDDKQMVTLICERIMGWQYWDGRKDVSDPQPDMFAFWGRPNDATAAVYLNNDERPTRYWNPFDDIRDAFEMEVALKASDRWPDYITALVFSVAPDAEHTATNVWYLGVDDLAALAHATARQRAEAAIACIEQEQSCQPT